MNYLKKFTVCFAVFYILALNVILARLANENEIPLRTDYYKTEILVNPDGSYEEIIEFHDTIMKEGGRESSSRNYLYYDEGVSKIDILEAKVITDGKAYDVDKNMIEDKPLASPGHGFDQKRQILISFPNLEINSTVRLKYKYTNMQPVLANTYSVRILGGQYYVKSLQIKLKSAIPLNIKVNDPNALLKVHTNKEKNFSNLEITNIKPLNHIYLEEPYNGLLNDANLTWISLSSINTWEEVGKKFASKYEEVINQPLPKIFQEIKAAASVVSGDINKINTVTSMLNQKIQYMGDWRTINGMFFPRSLEVIAKSQVGDCKDFSVSTAAILKHLGYKVQAALVIRGERKLSLANLPGSNNFNHAILKATTNEGVIYWVDPTNIVSMVQGIFPDLSGKEVLVLDSNMPSYEKIPHISPEHAQILYNLEIKPGLKDNAVLEKGRVFLKGEKAITLTGAQLYTSKNAIENQIFYALTGSYIEEDPNKYVIFPELTSRIVNDFEFKYQFKKNNQLINTNLGHSLKISNPEVLGVIANTNLHQLSDLILGFPYTLKKHTVIKKRKIKKIENLNYTLDTPWVYFKRECKNKSQYAEINDTLKLKTSIIANRDLKSDLFRKLQQDLKNIVLEAGLILN